MDSLSHPGVALVNEKIDGPSCVQTTVLTNYFTLQSLVREWNDALGESEIYDIWSQERGEITIGFRAGSGQVPGTFPALKVSVQSPLRFAVMHPSTRRAKKNAASLFPDAIGCKADGFSISEHDRLVCLHLADGKRIQIEVFGPRANIYLIDSGRLVIDRFRQKGCSIGDPASVAREWHFPEDLESFRSAFDQASGSLQKRLGHMVPVFDATLKAEVARRAGLDPNRAGAPDEEFQERVYGAIRSLFAELEAPNPTIYWEADRVRIFTLVDLQADAGLKAERFESVNEAVRVFVTRKQSQRSFDDRLDPVRNILQAKLTKLQHSLDIMEKELARESRADRYEHFGHLLMAFQHQVDRHADLFTVDDAISGTLIPVEIPLRPELSAVENAERYYDRARATRKAREQSRARLAGMQRKKEELQSLSNALNEVKKASDIDLFLKGNKDRLAAFSSQRTGIDQQVPFRRYDLGNGYEVWVGRNAAQNDRLTMKEARPYDIWLHARGVAGSHTVLRVPRRNIKPARKTIEVAAAIAAFHSKARTSELAPVIVVERRYVRKPRKSPPGTVVVEREEVLMVKPALPASAEMQ